VDSLEGFLGKLFSRVSECVVVVVAIDIGIGVQKQVAKSEIRVLWSQSVLRSCETTIAHLQHKEQKPALLVLCKVKKLKVQINIGDCARRCMRYSSELPGATKTHQFS
jgi:hypothetical protein